MNVKIRYIVLKKCLTQIFIIYLNIIKKWQRGKLLD